MKNFANKIKSFFKSNLDIIRPTAVLALICIVVTLALSSANLLTENKIKALAQENQNKAMSKLIKADSYNEQTDEIDGEEITYTTAENSDGIIGYIFTVDVNGYGGALSVMTAINTDGTVAAIEILDASNETPGLGQNVTKQDFYTQYSGVKSGVEVVKDGTGSADNNTVNAVTGATISSKAVTKSVNTALDYAEKIMSNKGGNS
ncbi:MAG: FMN-binding protein [Acutalibacteraceae bacterium]|nr:FMN-binding protein [Acutalibacteraceae bacterium]